MLILWGLMQKMPTRFKRRCAYTIPAVIAAGRAGGTVMVMMSRDSTMMVLAGTWIQKQPSSIDRQWYLHDSHVVCRSSFYLVHYAEDDGVDEADPCHPHQTQQEQVGVSVQLEVCGFGVEDGAHQLAFLCAEACGNTLAEYVEDQSVNNKSILITKATSCCYRHHFHLCLFVIFEQLCKNWFLWDCCGGEGNDLRTYIT